MPMNRRVFLAKAASATAGAALVAYVPKWLVPQARKHWPIVLVQAATLDQYGNVTPTPPIYWLTCTCGWGVRSDPPFTPDRVDRIMHYHLTGRWHDGSKWITMEP